MKTALITGITGQDGSYLAELLLSKDYVVHGIVRHIANLNDNRYYRVANILSKLKIHFASIEDYPTLREIVSKVKPDECYHLAAQSFVADSFKYEHSTLNTNITGTLNMLSIIHQVWPECKFYFAGSSEMFGKSLALKQDETTSFHPVSPYGISKVAGFELTEYYRRAFNMFAVSGILFNHESPRRGEQFVSKKIVQAVAKIKNGEQTRLRMGNIEAKRDWGYAPDYVRAMWLMLQQNNPEDYVIATGKTYSVEEFLQLAFDEVGLNYKDYLQWNDSTLQRPIDINYLCGDATKAREKLFWEPIIDFKTLVKIMVLAEIGGK